MAVASANHFLIGNAHTYEQTIYRILQGHDCIQFVKKIFMRRSIFNNH